MVNKEPELIYDPENWETTYDYRDRNCLADDLSIPPGQFYRFRTLVHSTDKYAACVVLSRDESGGPEDTEIQWFDTEEDALAAVGAVTSA